MRSTFSIASRTRSELMIPAVRVCVCAYGRGKNLHAIAQYRSLLLHGRLAKTFVPCLAARKNRCPAQKLGICPRKTPRNSRNEHKMIVLQVRSTCIPLNRLLMRPSLEPDEQRHAMFKLLLARDRTRSFLDVANAAGSRGQPLVMMASTIAHAHTAAARQDGRRWEMIMSITSDF